MRNLFFFMLMCLGLALSAGCASVQTSSVYDRNSEIKMIVIQEKIEDGLKTGVLTPEQSQMHLATLKEIQTDYAGLIGKSVSREERGSLQGRLDVLEHVVNRNITPPKKNDEPKDSFWERFGRDMGVLPRSGKTLAPTRGDRIIVLQRKIDNGRSGGAFSLKQGSDFQVKLDYIRRAYLRMMEEGGSVSIEEGEVISRLLDSLESDLDQVPRL